MALIPKINVRRTGGVLVGAVATKYATNSFLAGQGPWVRNGVPFLAGILLSGSKNSFLKGLGDGAVAVGGSNLAADLLPIPGISEDVMLAEDVMLNDHVVADEFSSGSYDSTSGESGEMDY